MFIDSKTEQTQVYDHFFYREVVTHYEKATLKNGKISYDKHDDTHIEIKWGKVLEYLVYAIIAIALVWFTMRFI